jgi:hypothetical protein
VLLPRCLFEVLLDEAVGNEALALVIFFVIADAEAGTCAFGEAT